MISFTRTLRMIKSSKSPKITSLPFPIMETKSNQRFSEKSVKSGFNCSRWPTRSTTIILSKTRLSKATIPFTTMHTKRRITFSRTVSTILRTFRRFRLKRISSLIQIRTRQIRSLNKKIITWLLAITKGLRVMQKKQKEDEAMKPKIRELTKKRNIDAEPRAMSCIWMILKSARLYTRTPMNSRSHRNCQETSRRNPIQW